MRILYIKKKSPFTPISYGKLYNWWVGVDSRGIAPSGWHMPTYTEYNTLMATAGGTSVAGGHLKQAGLTHWTTPNTDADNSTGFTAVGGGRRAFDTGAFSALGLTGELHTTYSFNDTNSMSLLLSYNTATFSLQQGSKKYGHAIRLIKDDSTDPGSVTDYDGNVYETIKIGNQVWMKSNLIVEHYNNGDTIANVTDNSTWAGLTSGAWCHYNNESSYQ